LTSHDLLSDVFGNLCLCEIRVTGSAVKHQLDRGRSRVLTCLVAAGWFL